MADVELRDAPRRVSTEARQAANSPVLDALARAGLAARGISYGLVGVLAAWLALGGDGKATSRDGALATIADEALGQVLLVLLAIGFAGYAVWRLAQAVFDKEDEGTGALGIAKRATNLGRGVLYAILAYVAVRLTFGGGGSSGSENEKARNATAEVLDWPAGTWLVGLAGLVVIGVGLFSAYRGVTQSFLEKWKTEELGATERRAAAGIGTLGLAARGVVFSLIGLFLVKAAVEYEPQEAVGLDGALQELRGQTYGSWLLLLTAVGLLAYAAYQLFAARYRRV